MLKKNRQKEAQSVPPQSPTQETLLAEAEKMEEFVRVTIPITDILPEAREMLLARGDVADLQARGYPINDEMFERVDVLAKLLSEDIDEAEVVDERREQVEASAQAREELLWIRERIARIAEATDVDEIFRVDTVKHEDVIRSMSNMLGRVKLIRHELADLKRVDELIARAEKVMAMEVESRTRASMLAGVRKSKVKTAARLKRMLFDQMRHISKVGLAAYPDDDARDVSYRLARFVRKAKSAKEDPTPEVKDPNISA